jgi:hypothetical protein
MNVFDADIFYFLFWLKFTVRIRTPAVVYGTFTKRFFFILFHLGYIPFSTVTT